jgi:LPS export ABC transporter permease LptF/LPS export ABC transporter permease LptG
MGILNRAVFREIASGAFLGTGLFTFVLLLRATGKQLFEVLVRSSAGPETVGYLFLLILPSVLTLTLPLGALVGIIIGLSRMSSDGEIIAMRAAGVPSRKVITPVLAFSSIFLAGTAACSLWLTPWSLRETGRVINRLIAEELTAEIQPRVFQEQFPNSILYVDDVIAGAQESWRHVFLADLSSPGQRSSAGQGQAGEGPRIMVADRAIAIPDVRNNRIQLHMIGGSTYETARDPSQFYTSSAPIRDQVLQAARPGEIRSTRPNEEMDTGPLWREARRSREANIELQRRLALPFACVLLALIGIPLGASSRKTGKSGAFVITVFLAFLYYTGLVSLVRLANQGAVPVIPAIWAPNAIFAAFGMALMFGLDRPGDRDIIGRLRARFAGLWARVRGGIESAPSAMHNSGRFGGLRLLPQVIDTYVLSNFLFYFTLLLASFVLMTDVYTFFELLGDTVRNNVGMPTMMAYLFFLTPQFVFDSAPISVMVAVLVTFGVMAKHNEVTAFKACGVSLHRLAIPVLLASVVFSGGLFALDYYGILPEANRRQEALRTEIKNPSARGAQTFLRPDRKWMHGMGPRIYYYKYFDQAKGVMVGVSVYELALNPFRLSAQITAERATWEPRLKTWIFENGWRRQLDAGASGPPYVFKAATFPETTEPPEYFLKEVIQEKQMNFRQLRGYIGELDQSGFDTIHLRVELHKKFSVPLFAFIMALISVPFAFLTGSRGAMAGVGVSLGIAVAYWTVNQVFEQFGNMNQLPAAVAAWSPDVVFSLAAGYLLARMNT